MTFTDSGALLSQYAKAHIEHSDNTQRKLHHSGCSNVAESWYTCNGPPDQQILDAARSQSYIAVIGSDKEYVILQRVGRYMNEVFSLLLHFLSVILAIILKCSN